MFHTKRRKIKQYLIDQSAIGELSTFDCLLNDYLCKMLRNDFRRFGVRGLSLYIDWRTGVKCIDIQGRYRKWLLELQIEADHFEIGYDPDEPDDRCEYPLISKEHLFSVIAETVNRRVE